MSEDFKYLKSLDTKMKPNPKTAYKDPYVVIHINNFTFNNDTTCYNIVSSEIINLTDILESVLFGGPVQVVSAHATHINTTHTSIFYS